MELWVTDKLYKFAMILLRVPPLFVIDELFRMGMGVPDNFIIFNSTDNGFELMEPNDGLFQSVFTAAENAMFCPLNSTLSSSSMSSYSYSFYSFQLLMQIFGKFVVCCFGCAAALCIFMLSTRHLLTVYLHLISTIMIILSFQFNIRAVTSIIVYVSPTLAGNNVMSQLLNLLVLDLMYNGPGLKIVINCLLQFIFAQEFVNLYLGPKNKYIKILLVFNFIMPSIAAFLSMSIEWKLHICIGAVYLPSAMWCYVLWTNVDNIKEFICDGIETGRTFARNYGLSALAETQWARLNVPNVLRTFWIIRVIEQLIQILLNDYDGENFDYVMVIKTLMVNGCDTVTAVLGMTSIISVICRYIGSFSHWVLLTSDEDDKTIGTVSAMLFYILAMQVGLTGLDEQNRLLRLCRNLCLLFAAVLHYVHSIVNPLLMSLSASHSPALHRHMRALAVCAFLVVFPVWLITFLWSRYQLCTWLVAVTVFSIEILIKVFISISIYLLFLYDAYRKTYWDELDDYVYYIRSFVILIYLPCRSFGNMVEFAFGIILFFNSVWVLVFDSGGFTRAIMMCVHAYFNLWCEARAGWSVFIKRRHAMNKINSLPEATRDQLDDYADVCAICYQEMQTAKMTKCKHLFHGVCLRKWLYVQDCCPLCHEVIHTMTKPPESSDEDRPAENNGLMREMVQAEVRVQEEL